MVRKAAEKYTVLLGNIVVQNCVFVFRLFGKGMKKDPIRLRTGDDGKLLVDLQLNDATGRKKVQIHNNKFAYVADGFEATITEKWTVRDRKTGQVHLEVEVLGKDSLKIKGLFWIDGKKWVVDDQGLLDPNNNRFSGGNIESCGAAFGISTRREP